MTAGRPSAKITAAAAANMLLKGGAPLHFGIGTASVATIQINWPSGLVDILSSVAADSSLTVVEGSSAPTAQSQNISTRLDVQTDANVGIGGFIINGSGQKQVLIRGIGPSLASVGVQGVLADPVLELHLGDGSVVANDNWGDTQAAEISATGLAPSDSAEAAIVATLDPGAYTAILSGRTGTGIGLVEVYALDTLTSELANVSTRGFVGSGDNVLIGGVIVGPSGAPDATLVARALGPSLATLGVAGSLSDPSLELHNSDGALIASNDDWEDDSTQAASIEAIGLAPPDSRESAIYFTAPTGPYTAIVRGSNGTTGVALVEIYNVK